MPSATAEDYIKAIYQLRDGDEPVATSAIADSLDVTAPTVTATTKRLEDAGLAEREEYKGVRPTPVGSLQANASASIRSVSCMYTPANADDISFPVRQL